VIDASSQTAAAALVIFMALPATTPNIKTEITDLLKIFIRRTHIINVLKNKINQNSFGFSSMWISVFPYVKTEYSMPGPFLVA
jgi:hypothetical protein